MSVKAIRTTESLGNYPLPAQLEFTSLTIGGTSTNVALDDVELVRLCAEVPMWVKIGALTTDATVTAGAAGSVYLPANAAEYFPVYSATGLFLAGLAATGAPGGRISIGKAI